MPAGRFGRPAAGSPNILWRPEGEKAIWRMGLAPAAADVDRGSHVIASIELTCDPRGAGPSAVALVPRPGARDAGLARARVEHRARGHAGGPRSRRGGGPDAATLRLAHPGPTEELEVPVRRGASRVEEVACGGALRARRLHGACGP